MSELTGRQSKTIHRLLEVDFRDGAGTVFKRDERNTLPADVIVVDRDVHGGHGCCFRAFCGP